MCPTSRDSCWNDLRWFQHQWITALLLALVVELWPAKLSAQVVLQPGLGVPAGKTVPSQGYDYALAALAAGDFTNGLEFAARDHQSSIRAGAQRWIDSIASSAVVGECHYELGSLREAVASYDEALLISAAHADW